MYTGILYEGKTALAELIISRGDHIIARTMMMGAVMIMNGDGQVDN